MLNICFSFSSFPMQSLLHDPNPNSPANSEAASLYRENRREYDKKVRVVVEESLSDDEDEDDEEEEDEEDSKMDSQHSVIGLLGPLEVLQQTQATVYDDEERKIGREWEEFLLQLFDKREHRRQQSMFMNNCFYYI